MKLKIPLLFLTTLSFCINVDAQKIYSLNELAQVPSVNFDNLESITLIVASLYDKVKQNPEKYSTLKSTEKIFYMYIDKDSRGQKLTPINPLKGSMWSIDKLTVLQKNDQLLFNLKFDETGNIIIPDTLFFLCYHDSTGIDKIIREVNLLSFEIPISENEKIKFSKIILKTAAAIDGNSLTGNLTPVKVDLPFNMEIGKTKSSEDKGVATKNIDKISLSLDERYFNGLEEHAKYIEVLKSQTNISDCQIGDYSFDIFKKSTYF